jgi:hypothetical protein
MPIIRRSFKFEGQFTQIPNAWLRDERLSLKAKGLLAQLLSHSDGWSVTTRSLASFNGCGRDAIRSAVVELEEAGYLTRRQDRADGGEFSEVVWETSEPLPGLPLPGFPSPVNPTYKKTKEKNKNIKKYADNEILSSAFEQFWNQYPRKVGKAAARDKFFALGQENVEAILNGVFKLAQDSNLPPKEFIPYPATWLSREGWLDEPYPKREQKPWERPAETPGVREWVRELHNIGEHFNCLPGEFDCR